MNALIFINKLFYKDHKHPFQGFWMNTLKNRLKNFIYFLNKVKNTNFFCILHYSIMIL